jgi:ornithine cyclodeaminase/alanine dehydrogenase-like protein (mu-crystallin family)
VSALSLAPEGAKTVGLIGCGRNGAFAARALAASGFGPGVCADARPGAAEALAGDLGWRAGSREEAASQDVVVTMTPGEAPVILASDLRPGQHLAVLGADSHEKSEVELDAVARCRLFCDEWEQASHGGELSGAVEAGAVTRAEVTQLGDVLTGEAPGRRDGEEITLFDSTGLAIQDLAMAIAAYEAWKDGRIEAQTIELGGPAG